MLYNPAIDEELRNELAAMDAVVEVEGAAEDRLSLHHDVERLYMLTEALWRIMKEQHGYSEELLQQKVAEIDAQDGRVDGQVAPKRPEPCPRCQRLCGHSQTVCLYCGQELQRELFER